MLPQAHASCVHAVICVNCVPGSPCCMCGSQAHWLSCRQTGVTQLCVGCLIRVVWSVSTNHMMTRQPDQAHEACADKLLQHPDEAPEQKAQVDGLAHFCLTFNDFHPVRQLCCLKGYHSLKVPGIPAATRDKIMPALIPAGTFSRGTK